MKIQSNRKKSGAFTLIEIMVVVVILGILAATIIPQFMGTTHDAKVSTAKANIAELESAIERFNIHLDRHPTTEEGLKVLVEAPSGDDKKWRGPYVKMLRPDPWETHSNIEIQAFATQQVLIFGRAAPTEQMEAREKRRTLAIGEAD